MNETRDAHDFAIVDSKCYFCGSKETIRFHEHYTFCPSCSAIYTFNIIMDSNCKHVDNHTPVLLREPWYKEARTKPYIYDDEIRREDMSQELIAEVQRCSICDKECIADGW